MSKTKQASISCRIWTPQPAEPAERNIARLQLDDRVEISFLIRGSGVLCRLGRTDDCQENDLFVFDGGVPHGFFAKNGEEVPTVCTVLFAPSEMLDAEEARRETEHYCCGIFPDRQPFSYSMLHAKAAEQLKTLFDSLAAELAGAAFAWQTGAGAYLKLLLLTISRYQRLADTVASRADQPPSKEQAVVSLAMREIMAQVSDGDMTLDTIASKLFISRSHLSRLFTRVTGSSFSDYVRDIRLNRACELLRTTGLSNEEIVRECGLKDIPSFYRLFKTHTGVTPYQYRMKKHTHEGEITMSFYTEISENLQKGKAKIVKELVAKAIEDGLPAGQILNEGLVSGMSILGEKFKNNEVYVPEVLVAARAMNAGMQLLKPLLIEDGVQSSGKVCIGTVQGDLHDIGKNLVKMMMEGKGLEVIDLGTDVAPETFVQTAIDEGCQVICCSALLTTTMDVMAEVVKAAEVAGIRDRVKIMIGGAPVTEEFCQKIGADRYTSDAASAADAAVEFCRA